MLPLCWALSSLLQKKKKEWEILNQLIIHDMSQEWATVKLLKLVKEAYEQIKAKTKQNWPLHLVVLYVKAADTCNCNSSSINCNYEKSYKVYVHNLLPQQN